MSKTTGFKADDGKLRWDLLPVEQVQEVVEVLTYSTKHYKPWNWQKIKHPIDRYKAACWRHWTAYLSGEYLDKESGRPHIAHMICCLLFLLFFEQKREKSNTSEEGLR